MGIGGYLKRGDTLLSSFPNCTGALVCVRSVQIPPLVLLKSAEKKSTARQASKEGVFFFFLLFFSAANGAPSECCVFLFNIRHPLLLSGGGMAVEDSCRKSSL